MPLNSLELERANSRLNELRRRLNDGKAHPPAETQQELLLLTEVVTSMLHVLDRMIAK
jgi:hypothetical protein